MSHDERLGFNPDEFTDPETGRLDNLMEFNRQSSALVASGNTGPILEFFADRISSEDPQESHLYRTFLLDFMERTGNSHAVLFQARILTELSEANGRNVEAATTSSIASSVYIEQGRFRYASDWFNRMRGNLRSAVSQPAETDTAQATLAAALTRKILEYEGYYFLELAGHGKTKQVRVEIKKLDADPVVPAERHHLANALGYIESDLRNVNFALSAFKKAQQLAMEVGDFADASLYASLRTTQMMVLSGRTGISGTLDEAERLLDQALESDADPEIIAKAREQLTERRKLFGY